MSKELGKLKGLLASRSYKWLLTGSAGFIGSHLLEFLLDAGQGVVSLDNFSTGSLSNLDNVKNNVGNKAWKKHKFIEGDIRDLDVCFQLPSPLPLL